MHSHGCDGLVVEGDKGHPQRLFINLLLLPLVVIFQLLLQLGIILDGLHLSRRTEVRREMVWGPKPQDTQLLPNISSSSLPPHSP